MLRVSIALIAALAAAGPAAAQRPLRMTCHELYRGQPMREPIVYSVIGDTMYRTGPAGRVVISRERGRMQLDTVRDRGIVTRTYASHVRRGTTVRRTVYWQRAGGPTRARFSETFDFARQRYSDGGPDSCHHNAFAR